MKKIPTILSAIIFSLIFISNKVNAQDDKEPVKSYLTFLTGVSAPVGNFGSSVYSNNSAGFAKKGIVFGVDGGIRVYKNFSIGYTLTYQDQGELTQNDVQALANGYNADFVKDITTVTSNNRFTSMNFLIGPQYSYSYKKFIIDVRGSFGFIKNFSTPTLGIDFDSSTNLATVINQLSSSQSTFAYGASAGLRWSFSDSWDLGIKENFIGSDGIKIEYNNDPGTVGRYQTRLPISMLQTTLGITVHL